MPCWHAGRRGGLRPANWQRPNASPGKLGYKWDATTNTYGARPPGYSPQKKEGAIIPGTGGDGSNSGTGLWFEGAMTMGVPPDSTDDAVQANIVAAGYGQ